MSEPRTTAASWAAGALTLDAIQAAMKEIKKLPPVAVRFRAHPRTIERITAGGLAPAGAVASRLYGVEITAHELMPVNWVWIEKSDGSVEMVDLTA